MNKEEYQTEHTTPLSLGEGLGGEAFIYYSAYNT